MRLKVLKKQNNSDMCMVCGTENPASLNAKYYELENDILVGVCQGKDIHQSYPERMHGGMISALLDETIGRSIQISHPDDWAVTGELAVKFRKPVLLNETIYCVAKITKDTSRVFVAKGFVENENGELLASASGTFVKAPVDKIANGKLND